MTRTFIDRTRTTIHLGRNAFRRAFGSADYSRWNSPEGLEEWWDERTHALASLVPAGSTVLEFGAGRRQLEKYLPADCAYIPSDLVDRGAGTIVCDLNRRPFPVLNDVAPTVAVFSGVLEYVKEPQSVIRWLVSSGVHTFVLSFDAAPAKAGWYEALRERRRRLHFGYMNNLTHSELTAILVKAGLECAEERVWTHQRLYRFVRPGH